MRKDELLKEITIRFYKQGDEDHILPLARECLDSEFTMKDWRWRYNDNPAGPGIICLAFHGSKLVSHYAVSLVRCLLSGYERTAALSMTTMTHPEYRGLGLFIRLANEVYEEATRKGLALVYGYPNQYSTKAFETRLDWRVAPVTIWIHQGGVAQDALADVSHHRLREIRTSDEVDWCFDDRGFARDYCFAVKRDKLYFDWRYFQCPNTRFTVSCLEADGEPRGLVVTKSFVLPDFTRRGHIVDWLAKDLRDVVQLFSGAVNLFLEDGIEHISLWTSERTGDQLGLGSLGFICQEISHENFGIQMDFGYRVFRPEYLGSKALSVDDFYLTTGDCNIF